MKTIAKRAAALLCVVMMLSSMSVIPVQAAEFETSLGYTVTVTGGWKKTGSTKVMFRGAGIDYIYVEYDSTLSSGSKPPSVSFGKPGTGYWTSDCNEWCWEYVYFRGGKSGTYVYKLQLWNDSQDRVLSETTITASVR